MKRLATLAALATTTLSLQAFAGPLVKSVDAHPKSALVGNPVTVTVKSNFGACKGTLHDGDGKSWEFVTVAKNNGEFSYSVDTTYAVPGKKFVIAKGESGCLGGVNTQVTIVPIPKLTSFELLDPPPYKTSSTIRAELKAAGQSPCNYILSDGTGKTWEKGFTFPGGNTESIVWDFKYDKPGTYKVSATAGPDLIYPGNPGPGCKGSFAKTIQVSADVIVAGVANPSQPGGVNTSLGVQTPVVVLPVNPCPDAWSLVPGSKTNGGGYACKPAKPQPKQPCSQKHEWYDDGATVGCKPVAH